MGKQNIPIYGIFIAATHEQFFTEWVFCNASTVICILFSRQMSRVPVICYMLQSCLNIMFPYTIKDDIREIQK